MRCTAMTPVCGVGDNGGVTTMTTMMMVGRWRCLLALGPGDHVVDLLSALKTLLHLHQQVDSVNDVLHKVHL